MKKVLKSSLSLALALLLTFLAVPLPIGAVKAEIDPAWTVPQGYNENDYNKIVSFLELKDASGVKNGEKLSRNYTPNSPATWGSCYDPDYYDDMPTIKWEQFDGEYRVRRLLIYGKRLVGNLDISDLSELFYVNISSNNIDSINLTGCSSLWTLDCYNNNISSIDISSNEMLHFFRCDDNKLTDLDVSANTDLVQLTCSGNKLTNLDISANTGLEILEVANNLINGIDVSMLANLRSLDVSRNDLSDGLDVSNNLDLQVLRCSRTGLDSIDVSMISELNGLYCIGNPMTSFDLYQNSVLMLNELKAVGRGTVGCELSGWYTKVYAVANAGASFDGWYNAEGQLISHDKEYEASEFDGDYFEARFTSSFIPGDADGNGSVTIADAILTLRCAMELIDPSAIDTNAADIDGNGSITISDAVMIARITIGI